MSRLLSLLCTEYGNEYGFKMKKDYSIPKIYHGRDDYDITKRRYVYYSFRHPETGKLEIVDRYNYDHAGRLLKLEKNIGSNQFTEMVGVELNDEGNVTKTGTTSAYDASGVSSVSYSGDVFVEWLVDITGESVIGLSATNVNNNFTSINYGLYRTYSDILVFESGMYKGKLGVKVKTGDKLRVERRGNTIYYLINGKV